MRGSWGHRRSETNGATGAMVEEPRFGGQAAQATPDAGPSAPAAVVAPPAQTSPWLTVPEAATYAKVSNGIVYAECRAGRLRHARVGGRRDIRLKRDWIDDWYERSVPQEVRR
ncbi:MAG: helix-turn-helix domain-containing protein [Vicinamibacterales bacterium]